MMETIGEYEFSRADLLGCGAFAQVYKGRHKKQRDVRVAIKLLHKKALPRARTLLQKEIKILKSLSDLQHENLVSLLDCKETSTDICLVMEYCNAGDLADYLTAKHRLSVDVVRFFFRQIAHAMYSLQSKGVVHRDLKPQNILLCHAGKKSSPFDYTLKIADFGFARVLHEGMMAATLCGSPLYMAPEVIMTQTYDGRADLWSVGTIMYQCLYGCPPFKASTPAELKHKYEVAKNLKPHLDSLVTGHLRDLLLGLLKKEAKDRISFDKFVNHPFFMEGREGYALPSKSGGLKSSSPVLVGRQDSLPHLAGATGSSPLSGGTPLTTTPIPISSRGSAAASPSVRTTATVGRRPSSSPRTVAVPPRPQVPSASEPRRHPATQATSARPSSPMDHEPSDFVMVDASDAMDMHQPTGPPPPRRVSSQTTGKPTPHQSTSRDTFVLARPQTLPVTDKDARPIPVPQQSQAFAEICQRLSPVGGNLSAATPEKPVCEPMERGTPYTSPRPSPHPSPAARRHSVITSAASLESLSPPADVNFSVGTPPQIGLRRRSGSASPAAVQVSPLRSQGSLNRFPRLPQEVDGRRLTFPDLPSPTAQASTIERCVTVPARLDCRVPSVLPDAVLKHAGYARSPPTAAVMPFVRTDTDPRLLLAQGGATAPVASNVPLTSAGVQQSSSHGARQTGSPEGPVWFNVPGLQEETLLDDEHNSTLQKLLFIQQLTTSIIDLADSRLQLIKPSTSAEDAEAQESRESLETLCLYSKAIDLAKDALCLAMNQRKAGTLQNTHKMRTVVSELNNFYKTRLREVRSRWHLEELSSKLKEEQKQELLTTADNIIYQHVIDTCKTASVNELFGQDLDGCVAKYQSAKKLLHYLVWQADPTDKQRLKHYSQNVEGRLSALLGQALVEG